MHELNIVCADIGSVVRGRFGWWATSGREGDKPSTLASFVAEKLDLKQKVALGFGCPLFVSIGTNEADLTKARPGGGIGLGARELVVVLWPPVWFRCHGSCEKFATVWSHPPTLI